jgi:hypothetical protein
VLLSYSCWPVLLTVLECTWDRQFMGVLLSRVYLIHATACTAVQCLSYVRSHLRWASSVGEQCDLAAVSLVSTGAGSGSAHVQYAQQCGQLGDSRETTMATDSAVVCMYVTLCSIWLLSYRTVRGCRLGIRPI